MDTARYGSELVDVSPLGQSLTFESSGKIAKNRFLKAAMTERLSSWDPNNLEARGIPSRQLMNVYQRWGESDIGTIITGNIMIAPDQLESPGNAIIPINAVCQGNRFDAFREWAHDCTKHGSIFIGQVCHPGRQVDERIQNNPVSASNIQLKGKILGRNYAQPHPASHDEIKSIIHGFAHAAEFLHKAGFDGIEIHAAHGYLISQFLSKSTNNRDDEYGGNLENRSRIIFEIVEEIRKRVPKSFIIGIKLNSVEFQSEGFNPDECKILCAQLESHQFDFVELSGGTYEELAFNHKTESSRQREAFFLEFAEIITPSLKHCKTFVTGGFKTLKSMVNALKIVDGVGLARCFAQEPRFCIDAIAGNISGVIKQRLDPNNYALTNIAAGSQIKQMGKNQEPIDLSTEPNEKVFLQDMKIWADARANDSEGKLFGYIDLT